MALYEPHRFVKINLDINYLQLKNLYTFINNSNVITAPRYSRVGECYLDQNIAKLERLTHKNPPREDINHGLHTSSVVLAKYKKHENLPLKKRNWDKNSNPYIFVLDQIYYLCITI